MIMMIKITKHKLILAILMHNMQQWTNAPKELTWNVSDDDSLGAIHKLRHAEEGRVVRKMWQCVTSHLTKRICHYFN